MRDIVSFVGPGQHFYVAGMCLLFHQVYSEEHEGKSAAWTEAATSIPRAELWLKDQKMVRPMMVRHILCIIAQEAIDTGNVKVLEWTRKQGGVTESTDFAVVGSNGHLLVLEWAETNGVEWHSAALTNNAAKHGHVAALQWIHSQG